MADFAPGRPHRVWAATKLATDAGGWRQINRAGHPMMWPIFWPNDTGFSNGRTLADNAPEAMLSLVTNTPVRSGLNPSTTQGQRSASFPYVTPA